MSKMLAGSFVALITPFNKDGSVDFAAFRTLLKFQEDNGSGAILIMGSTGESSMLSPEEKKQIIVEKPVFVEHDVIVEKPVMVEKEVIVEKPTIIE